MWDGTASRHISDLYYGATVATLKATDPGGRPKSSVQGRMEAFTRGLHPSVVSIHVLDFARGTDSKAFPHPKTSNIEARAKIHGLTVIVQLQIARLKKSFNPIIDLQRQENHFR